MDKIEKIRQEIKQLRKLIDDHNYYLDNSEQALGYGLALDDIESFLDTLSEEPDKGLEEAADEMSIMAFPEKKSYSTVYDRVVDYNAVDRKNYRDGIIAGAEWQKSQMLKDAVEGEAEELYNDGESQCVISVGTYFDPGDKVYVLKAEEG